MFHEQEILCAIAGGIPATFPQEEDLANPELKKFIDKYINRNSKMSIEDQIHFWLYYQDIACSTLGAVFNYGGYHGGGSPIMEQIAITGQYDIKLRKNIVKKIAGMKIK
jgi:aromatic ring hydroxylase